MSIEPVAYINVEQRKLEWAKVTEWHTPTVVNLEPIPLYTQQEWVGLTNDELDTIYTEATSQTLRPQDERLAFAFAQGVAANLKNKNT